MIPQIHDRQVTSSGDQSSSTAFGISTKDSAHLMTILRDTLYSDKVMAVLREYGANAKDAHAQQKDRPISVHVPTFMEPTLEIRDYGPGLSDEEIRTVFSQYGVSTKREDNDSIGYLGIGSKSGFSYSDSFTIVSRNGGTCRTYVAVLDESEKGKIQLLNERPCAADEESGLTIQIGVRTDDIEEFRNKAAQAFRFYNPRPSINMELPPLVEQGVIPGDPNWLAVMGGVAYKIDLNQIQVSQYIKNCGGVVFFEIGDLRVAASREALKYDDHTKKNLVRALHDVLDAWVVRHSATLQGMSQWQQRIALHGMGIFGQLLASITFPSAFDKNISLDHFTIDSIKYRFGEIKVNENTRLIFIDDHRTIKGYDFSSSDYVIRRAPEHTYAEGWDGLQQMVKRLSIEGIPIHRSSTLPWTRPAKKDSNKNIKHQQNAFVFKAGYYIRRPLSDLWEPVDREESDEDVYTVLQAFYSDMYDHYRVDKYLTDAFDITPTIYGYKVSRDGDDTHAGLNYNEWRETIYERIAEAYPAIDDLLAALPWRRWAASSHHSMLDMLIKTFGPDHIVTTVAKKVKAAKLLIGATPYNKVEAAARLADRLNRTAAVPVEISQVDKEYPLTKGRFELLLDGGSAWIEYVQAIDFHRNFLRSEEKKDV